MIGLISDFNFGRGVNQQTINKAGYQYDSQDYIGRAE
jgi:hypothetical protein